MSLSLIKRQMQICTMQDCKKSYYIAFFVCEHTHTNEHTHTHTQNINIRVILGIFNSLMLMFVKRAEMLLHTNTICA